MLILYGTLYPFNFNFGLHKESVFSLLAASAHSHVSRGDVIANVILFFPFGFFAMQSVLSRAPRCIRLIFVIIAGAAFSFGAECTQSYIPDRTISIHDFAANTAGVLLGAAFGWKDWRGELSRFRAGGRPAEIFPFMLLGAWLCGRLFPFVPTLDVQNVKDALKPLFFGSFSPLDALRSFIITLVVCRLIRALTLPERIRTALTFLPLAIIAVKPFIEGRVVSRAEISGTLLGIAVLWCMSDNMRRNTGIPAFLLMAQLVIQGLTPFVFNSEPVVVFSVIPFIGFLNGSMIINILSFIEKIFLYGSFVWLLVKTVRSLKFSVIISVVVLTGIEFVQMFVAGHVSEITDPLLAVILGLFLYFLDLKNHTVVSGGI